MADGNRMVGDDWMGDNRGGMDDRGGHNDATGSGSCGADGQDARESEL